MLCAERSTLKHESRCIGYSSLVEPPLSSCASYREIVKFQEGGVREIDSVARAAHALVDDGGGGGLTGCLALNCDRLAAVWVAIGLSAHQFMGKSNDLLSVSVVGSSARAKTGSVVGDVASARAARGAFTT